MYTRKHHLVSLLLLAALALSHPSLTAASSEAAAKTTGGGNAVSQLVGNVKDGVVRNVASARETWSNFGRCNVIRAKQKDYREKLKKQWEFEEPGLTPLDLKKRLQGINGGITYDEFAFLEQGKKDRGKILLLTLLSRVSSTYMYYGVLYFPGSLLPSPFARPPDASARETNEEKLSRERSHAVIKTLLAMEDQAKVVPIFAQLNIFGRGKQQKYLDKMTSMGQATAKAISTVVSTPGDRNAVGAGLVLNILEDQLYKAEELTKRETQLVSVPNPILNGVLACIEESSLSSRTKRFFIKRWELCSQLKNLADDDEFLVNQKVDLDSLSTARLSEACSNRLIGGPGRSDKELRQSLADWLDLTVLQPNNRIEQTGEFYNANLARTVLLSYYSMDAARDSRSVSYLPRLLFQGQTQQATVAEEVGRKRKR
jgi:hypothetical protein